VVELHRLVIGQSGRALGIHDLAGLASAVVTGLDFLYQAI